MNAPAAARACPLCGRPNACGAAEGRGRCWCFELKIPAELLARLPPEARGKACVCRYCIEAFLRGRPPETGRG